MRLWRASEGALQLVAGSPLSPGQSNPLPPPSSKSSVTPLPSAPDYYYQVDGPAPHAAIGVLIQRLVDSERETLQVADELAHRYEEIGLLYTISDVLGRTIDLKEAARVIVQEVSAVVGARRSSILVHDREKAELRVIAGWGIDVSDFGPVPVDDESSIAAAVFRECQSVLGRARDTPAAGATQRPYRGGAYLSVPIIYPDSDGTPRPVGVINLTDRMGEDAFEDAHVKLVTAVAHQIGAAFENARLVRLDQQQQRLRREMELAHDLQMRLLPSPTALQDGIDVGAQCRPAESVGGDFYQFLRLPGSQVGIMLGDVSSHGFSAALVMALVLSAASIHAVGAESPEAALERLLASVKAELAEVEMHLALFYGVADRAGRRLRYANAGHPHAFRVPAEGTPERLDATAPPLGLADLDALAGDDTEWEQGRDLLLLFSDGITEAQNDHGEPFGEARVIDVVRAACDQPAGRIVDAVFAAVDAFSGVRSDDQTVVVLKA